VIALVLILQFYFTSQTQKDIFNELTNLSSSINEMNYELFINDSTNSNIDSALNSINYNFSVDSDSLLIKLDSHLKTVSKLKNKFRISYDTLSANNFNFDVEVYSDSDKDKSGLKWNQKQIRVNNTLAKLDSLSVIVQEINLSSHIDTTGNVVLPKIITGNTQKTISFVIPGVGPMNKPKIVKYNYSFNAIDKALKNTRQKNIIVTAIIFIFAVILVVIITKKFLKPIDDLKVSFGRVVEGDLNVSVQTNSNDEIGDLTKSFNYMVLELQKNKQKQEILERKERLASLGQLAAGVAHEIKNPLNAINLTIEHLDDKYISAENKNAKQYIRTIREEIQRLDRIVNNFLSYLRTEKLELKKIDVKNFFDNIIRLYERELAQKKIEVVKNVDDDFILKVDPGKMKTALSNIILNSIQAMPEKGRLTITGDSKNSEIRIKDNGKGMSNDEIRQSFDLFYTTKSSGSGLGLPTSYKIIKAHKAEINIDSEINKGTTVTITFVKTI
jgi:signal transduction histidine kinase